MANPDAAFGFRAREDVRPIYHSAGSNKTWKKGDVLELASGLLTNYSSAARCCIAADDRTATTSGDQVPVYPPGTTFDAQVDTATAYAATHEGTVCDFAGTTGIQELTLGTATKDLFRVHGLSDMPDRNAVGAHAVVICEVNLHTFDRAQPAA